MRSPFDLTVMQPLEPSVARLSKPKTAIRFVMTVVYLNARQKQRTSSNTTPAFLIPHLKIEIPCWNGRSESCQMDSRIRTVRRVANSNAPACAILQTAGMLAASTSSNGVKCCQRGNLFRKVAVQLRGQHGSVNEIERSLVPRFLRGLDQPCHCRAVE